MKGLLVWKCSPNNTSTSPWMELMVCGAVQWKDGYEYEDGTHSYFIGVTKTKLADKLRLD